MRKNKYLLIILTLLSVLPIVFIWIKISKNSQRIEPLPTPVKFELLKEIPKNGSETSILKTQSIEFQFSKKINKDSLTLTTTPYEPFTIELIDGDKTLLVRPTPTWKEKIEYTIKFTVNSLEGESLDNEIIYKFKIIPMTDSALTE